MPTLNLHQAQTLLEMFGGEDTLITVDECDTGHSGPGVYAYSTEYPDEGSTFLAPEPDPIEDDGRDPYDYTTDPCNQPENMN